MTTLQVTLPETASEFVARQVASGDFNNPSEYLTFLIEQARAGTAKRRLDDLLEEGLNSGPPIEFTPQWWRSRKEQLLATLPAERNE
jgi:antitoxin ParD1/3/4